MKKNLFISAILLSVMACTRNQEIVIPDANLSLIAKTESSTDSRTVVEGGTHVFWEPGDEIMVFTGEKSAKFTTDITASSATATFKGTFGEETWPEDIDLWAVYPYSEEAMFDGETITTTLPSEQVARAGSFGKDMNLAIAHSFGTTLQFYNVCGGIRFSVTEEGIKKVMFEGLNGEIISGKVKIGLSEDGKPVIQEVTGGSQFITLLPPSGRETFQKDTWYYIVAIPGALEKGYKLRFYRDTDYARRVSEKGVEIKRSIYGSIEKADEGIEYEVQTTHFPETEEEWVLTDSRIIEITPAVQSILANCQEDNRSDNNIERIIGEVKMLDGVNSVWASDSKDLVIAQLFNGVYINILVSPFYFTNANEQDNQAQTLTRALSPRMSSQDTQSTEKKALVLLPLYDYVISKFAEEGLEEHPVQLYNRIISSLTKCGFKVDPYYNDEATLGKFRGKNLQNYDVVYINTHGRKDAVLADGTETTALMTMTPVADNTGRRFSSIPSYCLWEKGSYYWFTTEALKYDSPHFNNTWIFMHACESLGNSDMYSYFLEKGAAAYSGFVYPASGNSSIDLAATMVEAFTSGMEVYQATEWTRTHSIDAWGNLWNSNMDMLIFGTRRKSELSSFYLFDPHPYDLQSEVDGKKVTLKWKFPLHSGRYSYQLFIKDSPIGVAAYENETNEYTYEYTASSPGSYSWYVKFNLRYNDEVISSYRTDGEDFIVEEDKVKLEAIDLGLSVKWANMNLGANRPEEYGDYYAWGETEPYYSSLDPLVWKQGKEAGYDWASYQWCMGTYDSMTKYCIHEAWCNNGYIDGKAVLDPEDDAAHVKLGGRWRMPTKEELDELCNYCSWDHHASENGVDGRWMTGPNGNRIFLPAAGRRIGTGLDGAGQSGWFWTSSLYFNSFSAQYIQYSLGSGFGGTYISREEGYSIRPVYDESDRTPEILASPTIINFGGVKVGQTISDETGRIEFTNTGNANLYIIRIACPEGFSFSSAYSLPIVLSPGESKAITVSFRPTNSGTYSGYIQIFSNASNGICKVRVTGYGTYANP